ncbi:hypothetical protein P152DRAFT_14723 [Eremomyces bilateralis CBS 781.70]|uniref:Uncharacterized protein n=1 Tax=Eremomyces bilateralis CBS 781.70 TaxID=1392243 RepID=A0A6G1GGR6_9PEZI|nr:uncharacterized protein P152DRAFT_14723 [Eremomyces bilateralis CBS 781.70]KAF1817297.1 hypothetical protein P152DRAFT_14723 [Eremomyces bilateralis CBS 781.70]
MLHEMMHINLITADRPHVPDKYYQGERAYTAPLIADWVLKAKARTEDVVQNADSYTQFVNAVFFTSKFGFLPPPAKKEPLDEELQCFGYDNEYVDKSQDKFIKDFCHKVAAEYKPFSSGRIEHEYDEGLPGQVRFKLHRTSDGTLPSDEVERQCNSAMSKIFHGCDTSTNWKHGGAYAFTKDKKEIYTYLVEPARSRPDPIPAKLPGTCDVWYKFWHAEFFIHGGLWAEGDYGQDKLLPNLRRCGVVTAWKFEYREESDKDNLEWYAYGHLPVGAQQWNCVRQAVVDSGGPPDIGCGGK